MEQPLDLSLSNTKMPFTIEYLTSNIPHQKRKPCFLNQQLPLTLVENKPLYFHSKLTEHVVPNVSGPSARTSTSALEIVNGGHGIKNPLFDCATEALQIKYGMKN